MALRLKQNEDFLRFITMGAAGSAAVARWLTDEHGHRMVELERYAMANKIWETKLKRLRLADLLCLNCGLRVEARAKSKLEITMSHSPTEASRAWDAGLRDDDLAVFLRWDADEQETVGEPQCFTVGALRAAEASPEKTTRLSDPKAASEGSEVRQTWRATVPDDDGTVEEVDPGGHKVKVKWDSLSKRDGGTRSNSFQTFSIPAALPSFVYAQKGQHFSGRDQFLLGVAEKATDVACPGREARTWDYAADLDSQDILTRYVAVKAAGLWRDAGLADRLADIAENDLATGDEGQRIRLEALGSLARIDPEAWTERVARVARDGDASMALEAVFILTELGSDEAITLLLELAHDTSRPSELRAAAVWGFGEAGAKRPELLVEFIADDDDLVALHAIAALGDLSPALATQVASQLAGSDRVAASAMAVLSRQGETGARALLEAASGEPPNPWALAGLGEMEPDLVASAAGTSIPSEIQERLLPMWARRRRSWLNEAEPSDPLTFIERQTIRHAPPDISGS